jgi:hypothetical protein
MKVFNYIFLSTYSLSLLYIPSGGATTCYGADGFPMDDVALMPCGSLSACCASNKTNADICTSSGLCYSIDGPYSGFLFQVGCTDPQGKAAGCPRFCDSGTNSDFSQYSSEGLTSRLVIAANGASSTYNVMTCGPGVWCCRPNGNWDSCCSNSSFLVKDKHIGQLVLPTTSANTSSNTTTSAGLTPSSTDRACLAGQQPAPSTCTSTPSNKAAVIGLATGLGVPLAISLLALACLLFHMSRLRKKNEQGRMSGFTMGSNLTNMEPPVHPGFGERSQLGPAQTEYTTQTKKMMHELAVAVVEMPSDSKPQELSSKTDQVQ